MFELLFTSFPAVLRYLYLKKRGLPITVWTMKTAVFTWAILAFSLFLLIFYFHPKTYAGVVPFRTVSVVAQTAGPVTDLYVENGQHVQKGDLLFRIENSAQTAALAEAKAQLDLIKASEKKAQDAVIVAQASVDSVNAQLLRHKDDLKDAETLVSRGVGRADEVVRLRALVASTEAELNAAEAQLDLARIDVEQTLPAQIKAAQTAVDKAQVALGFTEVHAFTDGTITQLSLWPGSPATTIVLRPAMVIIPDRPEDVPVRVAAGFNQVARGQLYPGMPAEIACDSNASLSFRNTVMPARVHSIQPAVASGQIIPKEDIVDVAQRLQRGSVLAMLELEYPEHEAMLLDGSGCIVQTYTDNLSGVGGHIIAATGMIKAVGLRLKVFGAILTGVGLGGGGGH
ncbi:HlyD family secretion protein [Shimia biformata]|uniref:HlyD family secretion protein n=1 Tax=Shimia biformata TaxID=1294299 RepID=UPI00194FA79F|nr:biotin/lipoyl-binding protein [Shimia biformata]